MNETTAAILNMACSGARVQMAAMGFDHGLLDRADLAAAMRRHIEEVWESAIGNARASIANGRVEEAEFQFAIAIAAAGARAASDVFEQTSG